MSIWDFTFSTANKGTGTICVPEIGLKTADFSAILDGIIANSDALHDEFQKSGARKSENVRQNRISIRPCCVVRP
jgi:hypothetical protein